MTCERTSPGARRAAAVSRRRRAPDHARRRVAPRAGLVGRVVRQRRARRCPTCRRHAPHQRSTTTDAEGTFAFRGPLPRDATTWTRCSGLRARRRRRSPCPPPGRVCGDLRDAPARCCGSAARGVTRRPRATTRCRSRRAPSTCRQGAEPQRSGERRRRLHLGRAGMPSRFNGPARPRVVIRGLRRRARAPRAAGRQSAPARRRPPERTTGSVGGPAGAQRMRGVRWPARCSTAQRPRRRGERDLERHPNVGPVALEATWPAGECATRARARSLGATSRPRAFALNVRGGARSPATCTGRPCARLDNTSRATRRPSQRGSWRHVHAGAAYRMYGCESRLPSARRGGGTSIEASAEVRRSRGDGARGGPGASRARRRTAQLYPRHDEVEAGGEVGNQLRAAHAGRPTSRRARRSPHRRRDRRVGALPPVLAVRRGALTQRRSSTGGLVRYEEFPGLLRAGRRDRRQLRAGAPAGRAPTTCPHHVQSAELLRGGRTLDSTA
jgi:hypothetical protein